VLARAGKTLGFLLLLATRAGAQDTLRPSDPMGPPAPKKPGLWHLGPIYVTPTFHLGPMGVDTNVFYTATDRITDFSLSGGPGLDLVLPLGDSGQFFAGGTLDYLYFLRTESQRRLRGDANGGFDFKGSRTLFHVQEYYSETFGRPNYEVDERIEQIEEGTRLDLKRKLFGRIAVRLVGRRARYETQGDAEYLGNNLAPTLTHDEYLAGVGLDYALSVKTSFVVEGDQEWNRFPLLPERDADSNRLWAGFRTDGTALIAGQAVVGYLWFRPLATPGYELRRTVADVNATWRISPKTALTFVYSRGLEYSAFETTGATPTLFNERYGLRIQKSLVANLDIRIFGRITRFKTDGDITVDIPGQGPVTAPRDDKTHEAGADLGYMFRRRLRVGVIATYVDRNSTISYFGIDGLVVGASIQYQP
jgi:hypothetical protein